MTEREKNQVTKWRNRDRALEVLVCSFSYLLLPSWPEYPRVMETLADGVLGSNWNSWCWQAVWRIC